MNDGLPSLPPEWEWATDLDGRWCAHHVSGASVYLSSEPPGCSISISQQRGTRGVPVPIAVAVMQANGCPWEPTNKPLEEAWGPWQPGPYASTEPALKWALVRCVDAREQELEGS